jgi:hypothetical protein
MFWIDNVMQTFPLELDNACLHLILFSIYQIDIRLNFFSLKCTNEDIVLVNLVFCILKWVILKARNYIKYNKSIYREVIVLTNLKNYSEVTYKWWLKTQKFETYIPVNNLPLGARKPQRFTNIYNEQYN